VTIISRAYEIVELVKYDGDFTSSLRVLSAGPTVKSAMKKAENVLKMEAKNIKIKGDYSHTFTPSRFFIVDCNTGEKVEFSLFITLELLK
jgi:hypothetical protein